MFGRSFVAVVAAAAFAVVAAPQTAEAGKRSPTYRRNRGRIVFQGSAFASFSSEKGFAKLVSKARRNKSLRADARGRWSFHFIAFLRTPPRAPKVNIVWYKLKPKREQVDYTAFTMPPKSVTLKSQLTLSPTQGFKAGQNLEVRVTRLIGGREKVYARARVTLR